MTDVTTLKFRLKEYLELNNIEFDKGKDKPKIPCINHAENVGSMIVNDDYVHCYGCGFSGDVFKVAGVLHGLDSFPEQIKNVEEMLGVKTVKEKKAAPKIEWVPIEDEKKAELYNKAGFERSAERRGYGDFIAGWTFRDATGKTEIVDVRFEKNGKKTVVTYWTDGRTLKHAKPPVRLYNVDKITADKNSPILIVEGCKNAELAEKIPGFVVTTWNGGTGKVKLAPWGKLKGRKVYIYPDDDLQLDKKTNEPKTYDQQPGIKAALAIQGRIPTALICTPLPAARKLKDTGADIEEALQCKTPDEMAAYILECEKIEPPKPKQVETSDDMPFKILGTDDYGRAFFVGRNDRMWDFSLSSLTKTQLISFANLAYWKQEFSLKGKVQWDECLDFVMHNATVKDFDPACVRGRGAWAEPDGRFCYHDGAETIGEYDHKKLYVKKSRRDIGLGAGVIEPEILQEIDSLNQGLSYSSVLDSIRILAWSTISPFCGALPWRPALLLTGPSGSGKSTIIDLLSKGISKSEVFSGGETTEPGVRQRIGNDSAAITIEESEADTKRKKINRDNLLSMMRQSASNDAPIAAKGTKDGKGMYFAMRSMFLFVAIDPTVDAVADDNRIFRVNLKKPEKEQSVKYFSVLKPGLKKLLTTDNCAKIRAMTWKKLPEIIELAHEYADTIQEISGKDARYSLAEGILQATYAVIYLQKKENVAELSHRLVDLYSNCAPETQRDEAAEMLDRIMDEKVMVEAPNRELISLREIAYALKFGVMEHDKVTCDENGGYTSTLPRGAVTHLRGVLNRNGLNITGNELLMDIASESIKKILQIKHGYHRMLQRHEDVLPGNRTVRLSGKTRRCLVFGGFFDEEC